MSSGAREPTGSEAQGQAGSPERTAQPEPTAARRRKQQGGGNMLPGRERRTLGIERLLTRLIATGGIIGIGVALGAILTSSKVDGWVIGLVIALVTVILSAILWSSRQL